MINAFNSPKIHSLENLEGLGVTLKYIFVLVGLREFPSKEERAVLKDHIVENYSNYSVEEIKVAFQLAVKKEFECEIKHYEMFSCTYFSEVFESYLEYRMRIAKEYMVDQKRKKDLEEQNKPVSPDRVAKLKEQFFNQTLKPLFEDYKQEKKLSFGLVPVRIVYESLKELKYIVLINDEQEQIKKEAGNEVENKHRVCQLTGEKKTKKEVWIELCQEKAIKFSFDKIISQDIDLKFE